MAYATPGQLCSYLGISAPSQGDTVQLGGFLLAAQAIIERRTGRIFEAAQDTTHLLDARCDVDGNLLWLKDDLCAVTTVINGNGVEVTAAQYVTEPRRVQPFYALCLKASSTVGWTYDGDPENAIAVTGRWAYRLSAPPDITQATLRLASWLFRQKDNATDLDRPLMTFDGHVIMPATLPNDVTTLLRPYVKTHA